MKLFAYGTLQHPQIQKMVWGEVKEGVPAVLEGYQMLAFRNGIIFLRPAESTDEEVPPVQGTVYNLTAKQFESTDRYETKFYKRQRAVVELANGTREKATVYVERGHRHGKKSA